MKQVESHILWGVGISQPQVTLLIQRVHEAVWVILYATLWMKQEVVSAMIHLSLMTPSLSALRCTPQQQSLSMPMVGCCHKSEFEWLSSHPRVQLQLNQMKVIRTRLSFDCGIYNPDSYTVPAYTPYGPSLIIGNCQGNLIKLLIRSLESDLGDKEALLVPNPTTWATLGVNFLLILMSLVYYVAVLHWTVWTND